MSSQLTVAVAAKQTRRQAHGSRAVAILSPRAAVLAGADASDPARGNPLRPAGGGRRAHRPAARRGGRRAWRPARLSSSLTEESRTTVTPPLPHPLCVHQGGRRTFKGCMSLLSAARQRGFSNNVATTRKTATEARSVPGLESLRDKATDPINFRYRHGRPQILVHLELQSLPPTSPVRQ